LKHSSTWYTPGFQTQQAGSFQLGHRACWRMHLATADASPRALVRGTLICVMGMLDTSQCAQEVSTYRLPATSVLERCMRRKQHEFSVFLAATTPSLVSAVAREVRRCFSGSCTLRTFRSRLTLVERAPSKKKKSHHELDLGGRVFFSLFPY
jgi:hypothetical protein